MKRTDQVVHPVDEPPGQIEGDEDRADQDEPGQKIVADAAGEAVVRRRRPGRRHRLIIATAGARRGRNESGLLIHVVHAIHITQTGKGQD